MGTSRLKVILVERDMSIKELSRKTGLSERTLSRIVNGHSIPTLNNAYLIADAVGQHISKVFPNTFSYKRMSNRKIR
jgi:putative transcriptional regulator